LPWEVGLGTTGFTATTGLSLPEASHAYFIKRPGGRFSRVSAPPGNALFTTMSQHRIVWMQGIKASTGAIHNQIVLCDTRTEARRVLAPHPADQWRARIEGDRVVWTDHRNAPGSYMRPGNSDIYAHDLSTGQTTPVCTHPAQQVRPDIDGSVVVWQDWRNNADPAPSYSHERTNADIYVKDLKTGKEVHLTGKQVGVTGSDELEDWPQISGRRVFFRMQHGKLVAVFMIDLDLVLGR